MVSRNSRITSVALSSTIRSTSSPTPMSASLPTDTSLAKPSPRAAPRDSSAPSIDPLCEITLMPPACRVSVSSTAFTERMAPLCTSTTPMLFGPSNRTPSSLARRASACWAAMPASPSSAKPSENTVTTLAPRAAHCSSTSGTWRPGTITKA
ncbi:hypothetical protein D3C72_1030520 [compost metagenome]